MRFAYALNQRDVVNLPLQKIMEEIGDEPLQIKPLPKPLEEEDDDDD